MSLKSMTGFARNQGELGGVSWQWEVRSVNGKSLDVRLRTPPGSEALDGPARDLITKRLNRGSVSATLNLVRLGTATVIRLNEAALMQVNAAVQRAAELTKATAPTLDGLLALRGVLEVVEGEEPEGELAKRTVAILASLAGALDALVTDRGREGERLARTFAAQLDEIGPELRLRLGLTQIAEPALDLGLLLRDVSAPVLQEGRALGLQRLQLP